MAKQEVPIMEEQIKTICQEIQVIQGTVTLLSPGIHLFVLAHHEHP